MTSSRRADFLRTMEIIYRKYAAHADGKPRVLQAQRATLAILAKEVSDLAGQKTAQSGTNL